MIGLVLGVIFLPLALWCAYALRSEYFSAATALAGVFGGLAAVVLALAFMLIVPNFQVNLFAVSFGAFAEECAKLLVVVAVVRTLGERRSLRSLLAVAVLVGLSFSSFENLSYAIRNPSSLVLRGVSAVPLHASLTLVAAMSLSRRFGRVSLFSAGWFFMAAAFHALFNLTLDAGAAFLFPALLLCFGYAVLAILVWKRSRYDPEDA